MSDYKKQRDMLIDFIRAAPVGTGTCCCGGDMKMGCGEDHTPLDQWDYQVRLMVQQIEKEDAAAPVAPQEPCARIYIHPESLAMRQVPFFDAQSFEIESPHWKHHGDLFFRAAQ